MARKLRIAALCSLVAVGALIAALTFAYRAARQVRPFYQRALQAEPATLIEGSREMESRATALYSDTRQSGQWNAVFTVDQINGWLATQLTENHIGEFPNEIRDPRVAIAPNQITLGFRTSPGGIETIASVDAAVFLTDDGGVAIRLLSVRAGALPLPVMQVADELATACQELSLPVRWTQENGQPVAIVELHSDTSTDKRQFHIDAIELGEGQVYVAGHTELRGTNQVELNDYELRLTPSDAKSALEIARRPSNDVGKQPDESSPSVR
ncbi:MAG: hypothetical protein WD468_11545 [Pirellulales bacterium]